MKWKIIIPAALVALLGAGAVGVSQLTTQPQAPAPGQAASSTTSTVLPVTANPIKNTSTTPGLTIVSAAAENNVDSAGATLNDRLQVVLKNSTGKPLTTFEIYYTMTDKTTGASEAYYLPLTGLTLAAKSETTVSFVNQPGAGNYPENKFSLYRSSPNQVDFAIEVSAAGLQIAKGTAMKSVGTGEKGD